MVTKEQAQEDFIDMQHNLIAQMREYKRMEEKLNDSKKFFLRVAKKYASLNGGWVVDHPVEEINKLLLYNGFLREGNRLILEKHEGL